MRSIFAAIMVGIATAGILAAAPIAFATLKPVDERRVQSAGIRKLASRHLVLYTDLPSNPEVDRLPELFDQAVPQWAAYFGIDAAQTADWQPRAFLIADRRRFDALGLMPAGYDDFGHGFSLGAELWLYDQPTAYYRRHLLLHEGTHVFMTAFLGGCGPGWYMEGTAELLATHRQKGVRNLFEVGEPSELPNTDDKKVPDTFLRVMPRDRAEVPMLGRIKRIEDAVAAGRPLSLPEVMQIDNRQPLGNDAYAWCWAAAKFLDSHPRYRDRFRKLKNHVLDRKFNDIVRRQYADDWADLTAEWQTFVATLDHGYDFERMAIDFQPGKPLDDGLREATVAADRGWQSSGAWLEAGRTYRVSARGRYQIAVEETDGTAQPWPCEPGGVTIEYHDGKPLGMLLGAIDGRAPQATLADAIAVGLGTDITPAASGTLYLRVNDSPGRLDDNRGELAVTIEAVR